MNRFMRRFALVLLTIAAVLILASCAKAPAIDLPPLPTYSDETPVPTPSATVAPTPAPSVKPSEAPIVYHTPEPENLSPSPVPTVQSDVPIISISDETLPENMVQYNVATLHGKVNVDKGSLVAVSAAIMDADGNVLQECYFTPMLASFSLAGTVNAELRFAELLPGDYTYILNATAEYNGLKTEKELIRKYFTIYATEAELRSSGSGSTLHTAKISQDTDNAALIWNFLIVYLDNPYGAAGVMGNIDVESQCHPHRVQGDLSSDLAFSESYTAQVDAGNINKDSFVAALAGEGYGSGYGLCQWSFERKEGLYDLAQERQSSIGDLDTQCIYLVMELEMKYPELLKLLKTTDNARVAAREFFYVFEQGAEMGDRAGIAEEYLARFAS